MTKQDLFNLYSLDSELLEKWHIRSGEGITTCVDDTWEIIKDDELYMKDFGYFSIDRAGDLWPCLNGFFIKPEYRTGSGKENFVVSLYSEMPTIFVSALHNKNVRGIKFLSKLPGASICTVTDNKTYFLFNKGSI